MRLRTGIGILCLVVISAALFAGCGRSAKAEPLDVTYYYLPG